MGGRARRFAPPRRSISSLRTSPVAARSIALPVGDLGRRASTMSESSSASDLVTSAVVSLRVRRRRTDVFRAIVILQLFALPSSVTDLCCALVALWIYAMPTLGAARGLLVVSAVFVRLGSRRSP